MNTLKISIEVSAGVLFGHPMPEYSRQFNISSEDLKDNTGEAMMKAYGYAQEYMRNLWNPQAVNWVTCTWVYY